MDSKTFAARIIKKNNFKTIAKKASAEYGSDQAGKKVAGAIYKKLKGK